MFYKTPALSTVTAMAFIVSATAQQGAIERAPVQKVDSTPGYQTSSIIAKNGSATCADLHPKPGMEGTYVLDREIILKVAGKPDQVIKAGSLLQFPAGVVHEVCCSDSSSQLFP
jgi:quercetin dioxygenase-like cupin family protein